MWVSWLLLKYSAGGLVMGSEDLVCMVGNDETILWRGKPDKKCFVLEAIFNPMLIFAIIWGAIDF